ncbi:FabG, Dehydrogenase (short-chain alcohol dehydrogenase), partial [Pyrenophora tritici-repentis]
WTLPIYGPQERSSRRTVAALGRINGLLNIVGVMDTVNDVDILPDEHWDHVFATNLTAP